MSNRDIVWNTVLNPRMFCNILKNRHAQDGPSDVLQIRIGDSIVAIPVESFEGPPAELLILVKAP